MTSMWQLYLWNLVCGVVNAIALTIFGAHLAARGRAVQSLAIAQAATFGVLLGAWIFHDRMGREWTHWLCPIVGFITGSIVFIAAERLLRSRKASRSTILVTLFAILLASTHLLVTLLPGLEAHMSQAFFGDLVTLGGAELWLSTALAISALLFYVTCHRKIADNSFALALLGKPSVRSTQVEKLFQLVTLALITGSIFALGLLFTLSMLFVPTAILSFSQKPALNRHLVLVASIGAFATVLGLLTSLQLDRLPTVPTIVLLLCAGGVFCLVLEKASRLFSRR